ncbi:MAG: hypothetical protein JWQ38_1099 [Flavipsychrobacter sp.]|nr:hypothetical protein [Flavipsychrobacter sp.]
MYTREETSRQRQAFWTTFGQYMRPIPSADGARANWVNYKTGIDGIQFKMDADGTHASIAIVLSQTDAAAQATCYEQFTALKAALHDALGEQWNWQSTVTDESGKRISKISTELPDVNINRSEDWPLLISFFKPRIIALDEFWSMAKYSFY